MNEAVDAGTALKATKWTVAVSAVQKLTTDFEGRVRFGLRTSCGPASTAGTKAACFQAGAAFLDVSDDRGASIRDFLGRTLDGGNGFKPGYPCVTNIDTGMADALNDPSLREPGRPGYVLMLTDGKQSTAVPREGTVAPSTSSITSVRMPASRRSSWDSAAASMWRR